MTLTSTADALFTIGLIIPVALSTLEYMTRPTWPKAATCLTHILVLLGYASSLFLSLHFEDHRAYMVAFSTSTFGACWLVIASIMNLQRLLLRLQSLKQQQQSQSTVQLHVFGIPASGIIGILGLAQTSAVACFVLGCVYLAIVHAGAPISSIDDALARVESEGRSDSAMFAGYAVETAVLCVFAVMLLGLWRHVPVPSYSKASASATAPAAVEQSNPSESKTGSFARTAYHNLVATVLSVLIRTTYHLLEFYMADPEGLEVAATSTLGFYLDLLPVFCACWAVLGQSTALNAADEVAEKCLDGWPWDGNEKMRDVC